MIAPAQSRAARALLDWSQQALAASAGLGLSTVRDFEKGRRVPGPASLAAIERALAGAGVELVADADGALGVKLRPAGAGDLHRLVGEVTRLALQPGPPEAKLRQAEARFVTLLAELRRRHARDRDAAARIRSDLGRLDGDVATAKSYLLPTDAVRVALERVHDLVRRELAAPGV